MELGRSMGAIGRLRLIAVLCTGGLLPLADVAVGQEGRTGYEPPRTATGRPDLQGVWTNASVTRLTRKEGVKKLVVTEAEALALQASDYSNIRFAREAEQGDPEEGAPEVAESLPPVGNYNTFWIDPGTQLGKVRGEYRTSWIISPEDGQIPYTEAAADRRQSSRAIRTNIIGPESLSPGERCLIGFGSSGGPPMLNVLYNNHYQIVQTPDHVLILVEMVHDARIIRLNSQHQPEAIKPWLGDSIGWWEGDTLVVETTNFHPEQAARGLLLASEAVVTERFTRTGDDGIYYEFAIDSPFYRETVLAEMALRAVEDRIYEYACHEGNYAMEGILYGARSEEKAVEDAAEAADADPEGGP